MFEGLREDIATSLTEAFLDRLRPDGMLRLAEHYLKHPQHRPAIDKLLSLLCSTNCAQIVEEAGGSMPEQVWLDSPPGGIIDDEHLENRRG